MRDKKVLVTGGAGFIGSHLIEALSRACREVIIIENLTSGKIENIENALACENVEIVEGSITNRELLLKHMNGIDYVFHVAAVPSVPKSVTDPLLSHEVNATGTLNILIAAMDSGVKKVIYSSSSSIYGDTPSLPKHEDMIPSPQSPYAVAKLAGEYYCRVFNHIYGLPTISLRYFNVFGPRQDPNSQYAAVIPRFLKKISEGKPPVIYGDGEQTRDFTFVKDVVQANIKAAESDAVGVYNIGTGERTSIHKLVEIIRKLTGSSIEPIYESARAGDILHSLADITEAGNFGYKPEYSLEKGIRETIEQAER